MPLGQTVEYVLSEGEERDPPKMVALPGQPPPADESGPTLTRRELEVAALVARGLTNRQIASELSISEHTVATHVAKILKKLGLTSRSRLSAWVAERGLSLSV